MAEGGVGTTETGPCWVQPPRLCGRKLRQEIWGRRGVQRKSETAQVVFIDSRIYYEILLCRRVLHVLGAGSAHVGNKSVQASLPCPPLPPTLGQPRVGSSSTQPQGRRLPLMSLSACSSVLLIMSCGFKEAAPALPFHLHSRLEGEKGTAGLFPFEEPHPGAFTSSPWPTWLSPLQGAGTLPCG